MISIPLARKVSTTAIEWGESWSRRCRFPTEAARGRELRPIPTHSRTCEANRRLLANRTRPASQRTRKDVSVRGFILPGAPPIAKSIPQIWPPATPRTGSGLSTGLQSVRSARGVPYWREPGLAGAGGRTVAAAPNARRSTGSRIPPCICASRRSALCSGEGDHPWSHHCRLLQQLLGPILVQIGERGAPGGTWPSVRSATVSGCGRKRPSIARTGSS